MGMVLRARATETDVTVAKDFAAPTTNENLEETRKPGNLLVSLSERESREE